MDNWHSRLSLTWPNDLFFCDKKKKAARQPGGC